MHKQEQGGAKAGAGRTYNVYVDGSVFGGGVQAGAGWVIEDAVARALLHQGGRRITESARATTTLAEIYAAATALALTPAGGTVVLHSDDHDLCAVLLYRALPERIARNGNKPALQQAYATLFGAAARHRAVIPVKSHIDDHPAMRRAHNFAREGAVAAPPRAPAP